MIRCLLKSILHGSAVSERMISSQSHRWRRSVQLAFNGSQAVRPSPKKGLRRPSRFHGLVRLGTGGALLSALPYLPVGGKDKPVKGPTGTLQDSAASLSHSELIKNAAAIAVDASCVLLTHCALAAISSHQEYAKMVNKLKMLLEDHAQFVGAPSQEDELWQDIIQQRVELDDQMQGIEDADVMLTSAILVVERAAEAAYQADAELSALVAGQHLQLVQTQLEVARKVSRKAKEELTTIQAQSIQAAGDGSEGSAQEMQS